jgi:hypothetical protein
MLDCQVQRTGILFFFSKEKPEYTGGPNVTTILRFSAKFSWSAMTKCYEASESVDFAKKKRRNTWASFLLIVEGSGYDIFCCFNNFCTDV